MKKKKMILTIAAVVLLAASIPVTAKKFGKPKEAAQSVQAEEQERLVRAIPSSGKENMSQIGTPVPKAQKSQNKEASHQPRNPQKKEDSQSQSVSELLQRKEEQEPSKEPAAVRERGREYEITDCSMTNWVMAGSLNVRENADTEAAIIGEVHYADVVEITGIVKEAGAETGWYRIAYEGGQGFASGAYLSLEPPTAEQNGLTLTKEQLTLYQEQGRAATYVNRATDGRWYDGSGREYVSEGEGRWRCVTSGEGWREQAVLSVEVTDAEGLNSQTLTEDGRGGWENEAKGSYTEEADGSFTGPDGTKWYRCSAAAD